MTTSSPTGLALVTGASTGIGRSLAAELLHRGYDVVMAADEPAVHEAAAALAGDRGQPHPVQVDLATAAGVETLYRAATDHGAVDVAALNAGVGVNGRFDQTPLEDELALVDLNVRSTVHLAKLLLRDMVPRGSGRLLITSSIAAATAGPYHATYAASKAFVGSLADAIGFELRDTGVTVTSLMPGPTDTPFFDRAGMRDTRIGSSTPKDDPDRVARQAVDALLAGRASVVSGTLLNRVAMEATRLVPARIAAAIAGTQTRPGVKDPE